ncbi:HAD family hydrolase [Streptomyces sp. DSM 44917]|uniref:HAD family hydrolase n=1 Tax=Streptomyces boetiae TaxID=3075541 RepID=A0ABU2L8V2_9ACTN|nr:HAD family hydrolase [Streptomyces sp. DSM 44917]MDT0307901.1 HAD family hydrolase [Streptomyces sp. DSM 44917]
MSAPGGPAAAGGAAGIAAVLWDIDDTLFDYSGTDRAAALRHFGAEGLLGRFPTAEHAVERWRELMEFHYARYLTGELTFEEQRRARARAFLLEAGAAPAGAASDDGPPRPLTDAEADAWFERYGAHRRVESGLFPDVLPALAALTPGYRHGLLSNSDTDHQEGTLRSLGIRDRFEVLLCSSQLGHAKPAPEAFLAACEALGLPPGSVAYVGDRPDVDAAAADAAGLHGIWLDRAATLPPPPGVRRITGLTALPDLLRTLPAGR